MKQNEVMKIIIFKFSKLNRKYITKHKNLQVDVVFISLSIKNK